MAAFAEIGADATVATVWSRRVTFSQARRKKGQHYEALVFSIFDKWLAKS